LSLFRSLSTAVKGISLSFGADPRKFKSRAWFRQAGERDPVMACEGEPEPSDSPLLDFARKRNPVQESQISYNMPQER
jgi:hypothetical protein